MNTHVLIAVAAGLLLANLFALLARQFWSPLRTVPGPFLTRLSSAWYAWKVWQGSFQEVNLELHKKHGMSLVATIARIACQIGARRLICTMNTGKIIRYGPNRYSINDLEAVKLIYGLGNPFPKFSWYSTWSSPGQWSLFADQSLRRHAQNRKQYQATYSMTALVHYESFVDECANLFVRRLSEMSSAEISLYIRHWFQCYAFDVIGMITYAKRLGFLDQGEDIGNVIGALEDHLGYATVTGIFPGLHRFLFPIKNYLAGSKGAGRGYVITFTYERVREAQVKPRLAAVSEGDVATQDFLTKFLAKHAADPDNFTAYHVLSGCVSNMVAGSDTTAISLSAVLYYLLKNPSCMKELREEESQQMPYLQAVIKEALRLHPATGLPLERVVPEGGATISGRFFPEGVTRRDENIFGDDADVFSPKRWLVDDANRVALMNRYWMPFGIGSRTCVGRHISMLDMCKLIPLLVRDFTFKLDNSLKTDDWHTQNYWFVKPLDFGVRAQMRRARGSEKSKNTSSTGMYHILNPRLQIDADSRSAGAKR
ncbi:cytochrome P450 [Dactylonectria macrodidyma]|uniref:Cytochrome P450 n=1 Tax=Dactylonectria macrodidyma TaxID=307937 RepID=A0A9P9D0H3_9HYPO|nr:cytochrome P450 [Dactylonectria macrodidyma]